MKNSFPFYRVIDDIYKIYVSSTNTAGLLNLIVELSDRVGYAAILTLICLSLLELRQQEHRNQKEIQSSKLFSVTIEERSDILCTYFSEQMSIKTLSSTFWIIHGLIREGAKIEHN